MPSNRPRKRPKALQTIAQAWKDRIEKWLIDHGARKRDSRIGLYNYEIDTIVGLLRIHVDADPAPAVFCRFEDPKRAAAEDMRFFVSGHVNPHSGKWNWHFDDVHLTDGQDGQGPNTADVGFTGPL